MECQCVADVLVRHVESHEIQTSYLDLQRLMMSRKPRVGQSIEAWVTVVTRIALTSGFRVVQATLDDVLRRTRGTRNAIWPAQPMEDLIVLNLIDQIRDIDLHYWTPARGWKMGCHQATTASHSTALESNKNGSALGDGCRPLCLTERLLSDTVPGEEYSMGRRV